jgi:hypothetical protein
MQDLYFLLGERKPFYLSNGEDLLVNIVSRLSLPKRSYEIDYCYETTPPTRKDERKPYRDERRQKLVEYIGKNPEKIIVSMGWMPAELLALVAKTRTMHIMGCRYQVTPFKYETWFTYDPSAALFDPNLYVDIMSTVSAAIRYAGRQIVIDTTINPYEWTSL